ncbi:DEAH-box ATP-dependent RNA helicase prp22 [Clydaea vesicula]|uniref:DEAH-box ATP-dependent RNA helicase prp22 n=1 Tax=Clydaea vesicula TaxID=447962 RepID=A0AAD5U4W2_9FUNG|nr:DEAH-box ATP-dependent RNA helicase prp22 [Clydaea vesicula]
MGQLDDFAKLELVNLITNEVSNHTGIADKTLAEFIITLHENSKDYSTFKQQLTELGSEFPDTFIANLDRLISTVKKSQKSSKSKKSKKVKKNVNDTKKDKISRNIDLFPALAKADDYEAAENFRKEIEKNSEVVAAEVKDTLNEFEEIIKFNNNKKRERSADYEDGRRDTKRDDRRDERRRDDRRADTRDDRRTDGRRDDRRENRRGRSRHIF